MSSSHRIGILVVAALALAVAFVALSGGDVDTTSDTVPVATAPADDAATTATEPEPKLETVRVRGGEPVDGVKTIAVKRGERARFEVRSSDTSDEVHLHGYDIERDVRPGRPARFSFDADAEGIFEVELHGSGTQVAELKVSPG